MSIDTKNVPGGAMMPQEIQNEKPKKFSEGQITLIVRKPETHSFQRGPKCPKKNPHCTVHHDLNVLRDQKG